MSDECMLCGDRRLEGCPECGLAADEAANRPEVLIAVLLEALDTAGAERGEALRALLGALEIEADAAGLSTMNVFAKALLGSASGDVFTAREALEVAHIAAVGGGMVLDVQRQPVPEGSWN